MIEGPPPSKLIPLSTHRPVGWFAERIRILNALFPPRHPAPPGTTPSAREAAWQAASRLFSSPRRLPRRIRRSNWSRRWAGTCVLACKEKPCTLAQRASDASLAPCRTSHHCPAPVPRGRRGAPGVATRRRGLGSGPNPCPARRRAQPPGLEHLRRGYRRVEGGAADADHHQQSPDLDAARALAARAFRAAVLATLAPWCRRLPRWAVDAGGTGGGRGGRRLADCGARPSGAAPCPRSATASSRPRRGSWAAARVGAGPMGCLCGGGTVWCGGLRASPLDAGGRRAGLEASAAARRPMVRW